MLGNSVAIGDPVISFGHPDSALKNYVQLLESLNGDSE
jgi:hypothetical protein